MSILIFLSIHRYAVSICLSFHPSIYLPRRILYSFLYRIIQHTHRIHVWYIYLQFAIKINQQKKSRQIYHSSMGFLWDLVWALRKKTSHLPFALTAGNPCQLLWWHPLAPHPDHFCYPDLWERGSRSSTPYLSWVFSAGKKSLKRTSCNFIPNLFFFGRGRRFVFFFYVEILPVTVTKQVIPSKFLNFRMFNVA